MKMLRICLFTNKHHAFAMRKLLNGKERISKWDFMNDFQTPCLCKSRYCLHVRFMFYLKIHKMDKNIAMKKLCISHTGAKKTYFVQKFTCSQSQSNKNLIFKVSFFIKIIIFKIIFFTKIILSKSQFSQKSHF